MTQAITGKLSAASGRGTRRRQSTGRFHNSRSIFQPFHSREQPSQKKTNRVPSLLNKEAGLPNFLLETETGDTREAHTQQCTQLTLEKWRRERRQRETQRERNAGKEETFFFFLCGPSEIRRAVGRDLRNSAIRFPLSAVICRKSLGYAFARHCSA